MAHGRTALLSLLPWVGAVAGMGCGPSAAEVDEAQWRNAEAQWRRADRGAYAAWSQLDPRQPRGREAWTRLRKADFLYRRSVELLRAEDPELGATLADALALAPMDPALYLPFARACRDRGVLWRAADFYKKYLAHVPPLPEATAARAELAGLGGGRDILPPGFEGDGPPPPAPVVARPRWRVPVALAASGGLLLLLALLLVLRRRHERPLRDIVLERPEVHQAVAYQIGCLRHEFLKHRIGAAGEALGALGAGRMSPEQRRFLDERLRKGEPLLAAWRAHVDGLERSLGLKVRLSRADPSFRVAERALAVLGRVVGGGKPRQVRRVRQALQDLERLDRGLGELVAALAYCPVDEAFLRDVLAATRAEWSSGKIELDDVVVEPVPDGVAVDVYRTDLRIVLKNIFRNAIAALGESPRPRRLAADVLVELEPTGEEVVRIRVRDSSRARLDPSAAAGVEHGLGIVHTALLRYDGSLEVLADGEVYAKAVVVRLFRSQAGARKVGEAA
jgi:signal transduction histidine kinase